MMPALHHLIYQSKAVTPLSSAELKRLLNQSRRHNEAADITGMLLYDGSRFLQVLEGPSEAVSAVFARIRQDCRHTEVLVLADGPVAQRQFERWQMGLVTFIDCPNVAFDDLQPTMLTITDAALCMLLSDFQRYANHMRHNQLAVAPRP
ncbi:BLUF domain-containing protein [Hymenobacter pini]|uniref:BLUF domain-containing protein n=1 Tax=Hymenobacter pini TaxID=2880879 RepID=UPI001CF15010|nr:BLUF domain-containing protein [Hymenobacter pini]MCA8830903.1 BLUF domain-containing protein [Hymenobacter pini]